MLCSRFSSSATPHPLKCLGDWYAHWKQKSQSCQVYVPERMHSIFKALSAHCQPRGLGIPCLRRLRVHHRCGKWRQIGHTRRKWGDVICGGDPAALLGVPSSSPPPGREGTTQMREMPKNGEQEGRVQWRLKDDTLEKEHSPKVCGRGVQHA